MKKIRIISLLIILFVMGCKKNKYTEMVCKYEASQEKSEEDQVIIHFKNDISMDYHKITTIFFDSNSEAKLYYNSIFLDNESDKIEVVDNKVISEISEKLEDLNKEEVKTIYEQYGFICK